MFCKNCGAEIDDKTIICPKCGTATGLNENQNNNDKASFGLKLICFIFPFIGIILYIVYNDKKPIKAKQCGIMALIPVCIIIGLVIIVTLTSILNP